MSESGEKHIEAGRVISDKIRKSVSDSLHGIPVSIRQAAVMATYDALEKDDPTELATLAAVTAAGNPRLMLASMLVSIFDSLVESRKATVASRQ